MYPTPPYAFDLFYLSSIMRLLQIDPFISLFYNSYSNMAFLAYDIILFILNYLYCKFDWDSRLMLIKLLYVCRG